MKISRSLRFPVAAAVVTLLSIGAPLASAATDGVRWSISPYIWASQTKVDLTARGTAIGGGSISFGDLVDATDAGFQGVFEVGRGRWSAFVDFTYLETSNRDFRDFFIVKTESEAIVVDAAVSFWPAGEDAGLNLFAGVRYTDLEDKYRFLRDGQQVASLKNARDFTDMLVGLRYILPLGERWALLTKGDYSFGDSEDTFQLQGVFRFGLGKQRQHGVLFGYRYKEAEFKSGELEEDFEYKGPVVGLNFTF
jgi:hypothetical protein